MHKAATIAEFDPIADPRAFRRALGRFATGVTVVTAATDDGPMGITANSFTSLSLTPPLVMWSPAKSSRRHDAFVRSGHFAVHVLSASQHDLGHAFIRAAHGFDSVDHRLNEWNVPILSGCIAVFECSLDAIHDAGDHTIIIGNVLRAYDEECDALVFANGRFDKIACPANTALGGQVS